MNRLALIAVLLSAVALAKPTPTAKLIVDKGSTYFRADDKKALSVGAELEASLDADGKQPAGKAVVMEVSGALARVSLDDDAAGKAKFVVLPKHAVAANQATASAEDVISDRRDLPRPATGPKLAGKVESGALRVTMTNDSDSSWSGCNLVYSDGRTYDVGEVVKHSDDAVLKVKFKSAPDPVYDHVTVRCAEGTGQFFFAKPTSPRGKLKGYATNEGKGTIVLYNQNDSAWTSCDVAKPDGTHYVLGSLKGHNNDSVNGGRFIKEDEARAQQWLELRCKEGVLHTEL